MNIVKYDTYRQYLRIFERRFLRKYIPQNLFVALSLKLKERELYVTRPHKKISSLLAGKKKKDDSAAQSLTIASNANKETCNEAQVLSRSAFS
jgi:hypothetical protein